MKKIHLVINGTKREFVVGPGQVLLELLREDLDLTGTKQSCDRKGQCGACTVIVDGKASPVMSNQGSGSRWGGSHHGGRLGHTRESRT